LQKQLYIRQFRSRKLSNLQNQKTIQQLSKKADGNTGIFYIHCQDQDAIDQAELDLKEAKLDLYNWERDLDNEKR